MEDSQRERTIKSIEYTVGQAWDGTAAGTRRVAMQALAQSEERFRQLADSLNDVLWIYEPQGAGFLYVSPAYGREWLRNPQALLADAREWLGPVHAQDLPALEAAFGGLAGGQAYALEYRITLAGGQERWIAERAVPVAGHPGQMPRIAGVSQDVTARKQADLALALTDRHKDEFLAMLAHELRNPLEPIRTAATLLTRLHADGPAVESKAVSVIVRQVNHLTRLVEDLLDVSRITHGKIRLRPETVLLDAIIGAAVDANLALAEQKQLRLRRGPPNPDAWVLGDPVRLTQVLSNLLHNATKFSVQGGLIEISVSQADAGQLAISVRDEGIGIAPALIGSVFDLFTQDEQSLAREHGGLGIGLCVVRSLTLLHGGQVSVLSAGVGRGSEFIVTLPAAAAPGAQPIPPAASHRAGWRVLLVDDNRDAAESMQALLELDGHAVLLAFNGQSALEQAAALCPDIVILDIGLPDISGYEVARRLKASASQPAPLLVALTGYGREQDLKNVQEAGFDHHLVKPTEYAVLAGILGAPRPQASARA